MLTQAQSIDYSSSATAKSVVGNLTPYSLGAHKCSSEALFLCLFIMVGRVRHLRVAVLLTGSEILIRSTTIIRISLAGGSSQQFVRRITMPNITPQIRLVDNRPITTSRDVAIYFRREHRNVIKSINNLECSDCFLTANFLAVTYKHKGNDYTEYQITRDGFTFLAMGFTGKKAAEFKEAYINAFNEMEAKLQATPFGDAEKCALLNAMIKQMGFKDAPVIIPQETFSSVKADFDAYEGISYVLSKIAKGGKSRFEKVNINKTIGYKK